MEWVRVKAWQKMGLTQPVCPRARDDDQEACVTEVMNELRVSRRSELDAEGAENGRSSAPMDVAMEMATVTAIAADTAGAAIFQPMESNVNGTQRRRCEAPAAPSDWRSHMEWTIRQQAQELTQRHRTVGHLANLMDTRAAREEAQRLAMLTGVQEREQKWDARDEDDKVSGAGIKNMIAKTMNGVGQGQEVREREREVTVRMDGGGLEASHLADTMREEGPEERQQPQQHPEPRPKLQLKL
jgi:hypothetical protein